MSDNESDYTEEYGNDDNYDDDNEYNNDEYDDNEDNNEDNNNEDDNDEDDNNEDDNNEDGVVEIKKPKDIIQCLICSYVYYSHDIIYMETSPFCDNCFFLMNYGCETVVNGQYGMTVDEYIKKYDVPMHITPCRKFEYEVSCYVCAKRMGLPLRGYKKPEKEKLWNNMIDLDYVDKNIGQPENICL